MRKSDVQPPANNGQLPNEGQLETQSSLRDNIHREPDHLQAGIVALLATGELSIRHCMHIKVAGLLRHRIGCTQRGEGLWAKGTAPQKTKHESGINHDFH
jgi:hypothetical protein